MSGVTTEGCSASWLIVFLTHSPETQATCRAEIDAVIERKRNSHSQSRNDVFKTLSLHDWEHSFPYTLAALREAVRLAMPGATFRKNSSGRAVPIGNTGQTIPNGAYAAFLLDNVHMDPALYPKPSKFDPERYVAIDDQAKEEQPHTYIGWGSGRHPCGKHCYLLYSPSS